MRKCLLTSRSHFSLLTSSPKKHRFSHALCCKAQRFPIAQSWYARPLPKRLDTPYHRVMRYNIDARGKRLRLIGGLFASCPALVVAAALGLGPFWPLAGPGLGLLAAGAFQVFEAWAGW